MLDLILTNIDLGEWLMNWPKWVKTTIMVVLMVVIFWMFLIRPQRKQAKKERAYRENLQKGDRVMTAGGIHVTVVSVNDAKATVEMAPGHQIKVQIASLQPIPERKK